MSKINIDPTSINDQFYRYKMSKIITKYEGRGNGQRTILMNIDEISKELNRGIIEIVTFLACSFGCQHICNKEQQYVLYGTHLSENIQTNIYEYIKLFVLCNNCRNPETKYTLENNNICLKCDACSKICKIILTKNTEKIMKLVKL